MICWCRWAVEKRPLLNGRSQQMLTEIYSAFPTERTPMWLSANRLCQWCQLPFHSQF